MSVSREEESPPRPANAKNPRDEILDSILRFDTPIRYSDSILRVVGGGCMSIVRSAITIFYDQAVPSVYCLLFCDGKLVWQMSSLLDSTKSRYKST